MCLDYTLRGNTYIPSENEASVLNDHPPASHKDWSHNRYLDFKTNLKTDHLRKQNDRCAICRCYVEPDGYHEALEHIVPKSRKFRWMFHPKNLIVCCDPCNGKKLDSMTLRDPNVDDNGEYPDRSDSYQILHPHFDNWSNHLTYEEGIFIRALDESKGAETIKKYGLLRYHLPINRARERKLSNRDTVRALTHRLYEVPKGSHTFRELQRAVNYFQNRI